MKIYFTCSTAEFKKYRHSYFSIRDFLVSQKHLLTRDWLPHTEKKILNGKTNIRDIKEIYQECIKAIYEADVVIVEDTVSNFSTGHQITRALQFRKPTLVLWQGQKHRHFKQMFIHGIESDILQISEYTGQNLKSTLKAFLKKYENATETNRFHLVLNRTERAYLDWAQFNLNKSRTKIIRSALRKAIEADKKYLNYLSRN
ncbi:MAG: hypothetical protein JW991_01850 [Candidatus Pacebacteria bacterium]|nr:hypothetical protein [Candidatus Paceibacterota bacterium]